MVDILIVDDERPVLDLVRDLLTGEGYVVAVAPNGQAALELLDAGLGASLVITDLRMPRLTGIELAATLRARHGSRAPAVAVMSANHQWLADVEGVVAKLPKPLPMDELVDLASQYCRAR